MDNKHEAEALNGLMVIEAACKAAGFEVARVQIGKIPMTFGFDVDFKGEWEKLPMMERGLRVTHGTTAQLIRSTWIQ